MNIKEEYNIYQFHLSNMVSQSPLLPPGFTPILEIYDNVDTIMIDSVVALAYILPCCMDEATSNEEYLAGRLSRV